MQLKREKVIQQSYRICDVCKAEIFGGRGVGKAGLGQCSVCSVDLCVECGEEWKIPAKADHDEWRGNHQSDTMVKLCPEHQDISFREYLNIKGKKRVQLSRGSYKYEKVGSDE